MDCQLCSANIRSCAYIQALLTLYFVLAAIRCPTPEPGPNVMTDGGDRELYPIGVRVTFTCPRTYRMGGSGGTSDTTITCTPEGEWDGSFKPACVKDIPNVSLP